MSGREVVVLRDERGPDGLRHLSARMDGGDVVISGQDLGRGVEGAFGEGSTEYEWGYRVRAADVHLLVKALGGRPDDDVLDLLGERCSGPGAAELERLLAKRLLRRPRVPNEFWNRVGD